MLKDIAIKSPKIISSDAITSHFNNTTHTENESTAFNKVNSIHSYVTPVFRQLSPPPSSPSLSVQHTGPNSKIKAVSDEKSPTRFFSASSSM